MTFLQQLRARHLVPLIVIWDNGSASGSRGGLGEHRAQVSRVEMDVERARRAGRELAQRAAQAVRVILPGCLKRGDAVVLSNVSRSPVPLLAGARAPLEATQG